MIRVIIGALLPSKTGEQIGSLPETTLRFAPWYPSLGQFIAVTILTGLGLT